MIPTETIRRDATRRERREIDTFSSTHPQGARRERDEQIEMARSVAADSGITDRVW
jgi:hypothetical protein